MIISVEKGTFILLNDGAAIRIGKSSHRMSEVPRYIFPFYMLRTLKIVNKIIG